jgi:hypothetical protein
VEFSGPYLDEVELRKATGTHGLRSEEFASSFTTESAGARVRRRLQGGRRGISVLDRFCALIPGALRDHPCRVHGSLHGRGKPSA